MNLDDFLKNINDQDSDIRYMAVTYLLKPESLEEIKNISDSQIQKIMVHHLLLVLNDKTSKVRNLARCMSKLVEILNSEVVYFMLENLWTAFTNGRVSFDCSLEEFKISINDRESDSDPLQENLDNLRQKEAAATIREIWKRNFENVTLKTSIISWFLNQSNEFLPTLLSELTDNSQFSIVEVYHEFVMNHAETITSLSSALPFVEIFMNNLFVSKNRGIQHYIIKIIASIYEFSHGKLSLQISKKIKEIINDKEITNNRLDTVFDLCAESCSRTCTESKLLSAELFPLIIASLSENNEICVNSKLKCLAEILKKIPALLSTQDTFVQMELILRNLLKLDIDFSSPRMEIDNDSNENEEDDYSEDGEFEYDDDFCQTFDEDTNDVVLLRNCGLCMLELAGNTQLMGCLQNYSKLWSIITQKSKSLNEFPQSFVNTIKALIENINNEPSVVLQAQKLKEFHKISEYITKKLISSLKLNSANVYNQYIVMTLEAFYRLPSDITHGYLSQIVNLLSKIKFPSSCVIKQCGSNPMFSLLSSVIDHADSQEISESMIKVVQHLGGMVKSLPNVESCQDIFDLLSQATKCFPDSESLHSNLHPIICSSINLLKIPSHSRISIKSCITFLCKVFCTFNKHEIYKEASEKFIDELANKCNDRNYLDSVAEAICCLCDGDFDLNSKFDTFFSGLLTIFSGKTSDLHLSVIIEAISSLVRHWPSSFNVYINAKENAILSLVTLFDQKDQKILLSAILLIQTLFEFMEPTISSKFLIPILDKLIAVFSYSIVSQPLSIQCAKYFVFLIHKNMITFKKAIEIYEGYIQSISTEATVPCLLIPKTVDRSTSPLSSSTLIDLVDENSAGEIFTKNETLIEKHTSSAESLFIFLLETESRGNTAWSEIYDYILTLGSTKIDLQDTLDINDDMSKFTDEIKVHLMVFKIILIGKFSERIFQTTGVSVEPWLQGLMANKNEFISRSAIIAVSYFWQFKISRSMPEIFSVLKSSLGKTQELLPLLGSLTLCISRIAECDPSALDSSQVERIFTFCNETFTDVLINHSVKEELGVVMYHLYTLSPVKLCRSLENLMAQRNNSERNWLGCFIFYHSLKTQKLKDMPMQTAFSHVIYFLHSPDLEVYTCASLCLKSIYSNVLSNTASDLTMSQFCEQLPQIVDSCICQQSHKQTAVAGSDHKIVSFLSSYPRKICLQVLLDILNTLDCGMTTVPPSCGGNSIVVTNLLKLFESCLEDDPSLLSLQLEIIPHLIYIYPKFVAIDLGNKWLTKIQSGIGRNKKDSISSQSDFQASGDVVAKSSDSCEISSEIFELCQCLIRSREALKMRGLDINANNYLTISINSIINSNAFQKSLSKMSINF